MRRRKERKIPSVISNHRKSHRHIRFLRRRPSSFPFVWDGVDFEFLNGMAVDDDHRTDSRLARSRSSSVDMRDHLSSQVKIEIARTAAMAIEHA